ncbi:hypothetical protein [Hansschlegelia sp. KR7-227]|uniref:hypothetical protein n=1 Tax=Hansschlegelia sp. KR7-227 TaxID=3400914 RepID=UPI003BFE1DF2
MKTLIGALKHMLRDIFRTKTVRRADEAIMAAEATTRRIESIEAEERAGSEWIRVELRRLQNALRQGGR